MTPSCLESNRPIETSPHDLWATDPDFAALVVAEEKKNKGTFRHGPPALQRLNRQLGMNVIAFMGYSAVRQYVLGPEASERAAALDEISRMHDVMHEGLEAGAYGMSFNVNPSHIAADGRPVPSRLASFDAVLAMAALLQGSQAGAMPSCRGVSHV
jgi:N-acyl-D-aspartate/D-glutamate deacylase